jgi:hypothetical protein
MRFSLADKGVHAVLDAEAGLSLICRHVLVFTIS